MSTEVGSGGAPNATSVEGDVTPTEPMEPKKENVTKPVSRSGEHSIRKRKGSRPRKPRRNSNSASQNSSDDGTAESEESEPETPRSERRNSSDDERKGPKKDKEEKKKPKGNNKEQNDNDNGNGKDGNESERESKSTRRKSLFSRTTEGITSTGKRAYNSLGKAGHSKRSARPGIT